MILRETVLEVDESNYDEIIENKFVVLQFFSDWKMNCLMSLPMVDDIADDFCEKYPELCFGRVNIEEAEELAERLNISRVPTILIIKEGLLVERIETSIEEDLLRQRISSFFTEIEC